MGKPITTATNFNPFNHVLKDTERFRIKDGVLTVEDSTVRSNSSAWTRFWTRGQYSQSAIIKEMGKLYKAAKNDQLEDKSCHINNTFLENYKTLVGRAITQNVACAKMSTISRFFNAKSAIDLDKAYAQIDQIDADLVEAKAEEERQAEATAAAEEEARIAAETKAKVDAKLDNSEIKVLIQHKVPVNLTESRIDELEVDFQKEADEPWWSLEEPDDDTPVLWATDNFIARPYMLLAPLGKKAIEGNDSKQLDALLTALDIYTVEKQKEHKINGPLHLDLYLLQNKDALIAKLDALDFIENS